MLPLFAADDAAAAGIGLFLWIVIGLGSFFVYMAPSLIAILRGHVNLAPIIIVNFFLGWICVGWIIALAWAFSAQERHRDDYGRRRRYRDDDYDD